MQRYGYVRVSTKEQNPKRQFAALHGQKIRTENIYADYLSGKDFSRPQYILLLNKLQKGDLLIVKSIDRLGRNYEEIKEQWAKITKEIGADIQVLDMPLLNTTAKQGDLTGVFIADMVLQILAYVAETERAFIRQRQAEGIAIAKENGVRFGRQRAALSEDFAAVCERYQAGEISVRKGAEMLGMSPSTFYRRCKETEG